MASHRIAPLVSVIIPVYNRAHCVAAAMGSVLDQSYSHLELIMVDDGSTDASAQVIQGIQDPRVRYVYQENAGACAARNRGLALAEGDYIAFHDSDDLWYPRKLEKQLDALQRTHADIVICKLLMHRPDGQRVQYPKRIGEGFISSRDDLFGIGTQTIIGRRDVMKQLPFAPDFPRYQDLEWIYRALKGHSVYCLDEALVDYEVGADSISASPQKMLAALELLRRKYPELRREYPLLSMHIVRNLAEAGLRSPRRGKYFALAAAYYPGLARYFLCRAQGKGDGGK